MNDEVASQASPFLSPTDLIKNKEVSLMFDTINHNAKSLNLEEKHAFICKASDLSILLERYTPRKTREETKTWYAQLDVEVKKIRDENPSETKEKKNEKIMELRYRYAVEVHEKNLRVLMNSPIIEIDVEGDLDINDVNIIEVIRGGKRSDDTGIVYKS